MRPFLPAALIALIALAGCKPDDRAATAPVAADAADADQFKGKKGKKADPPKTDPKAGPKADDAIPPPRTAGLTRVFLVLVADTKAQAAVPGFTLDVDRNAAAVRTLFASGVGADRLVVTELRGEKARPESLRRELDRLPVGPADTLVCYLTGQASAGAGPDGFVFELFGTGKPEPLPRPALRGWLAEKKPRLAALVSDTTAGVDSSDPGPLAARGGSAGVAGVAPEPPAGPPPPPEDVRPGFKALFLDAAGVVDLSGAGEGASGWAPAREPGFFTRSLVRAISDEKDDPAAAWLAIYRRAKADTEAGYRAWWEAEVKRIRAKPQPPPQADQDLFRGLLAQPEVTSRAYYLPGGRLKIIAHGTGGKGVLVGELPLDSPGRAAGLTAGDVIVRAEGADTPTPEAFEKALPPAAGKLQLRVRSPDGKERDVTLVVPDALSK